MTNVKCDLCLKWVYSPGDAVFFYRRDHRLVAVEISSTNVWGGVHCVCLDCCGFLDARTRHERPKAKGHPDLRVQHRATGSEARELQENVRGLSGENRPDSAGETGR